MEQNVIHMLSNIKYLNGLSLKESSNWRHTMIVLMLASMERLLLINLIQNGISITGGLFTYLAKENAFL